MTAVYDYEVAAAKTSSSPLLAQTPFFLLTLTEVVVHARWWGYETQVKDLVPVPAAVAAVVVEVALGNGVRDVVVGMVAMGTYDMGFGDRRHLGHIRRVMYMENVGGGGREDENREEEEVAVVVVHVALLVAVDGVQDMVDHMSSVVEEEDRENDDGDDDAVPLMVVVYNKDHVEADKALVACDEEAAD